MENKLKRRKHNKYSNPAYQRLEAAHRPNFLSKYFRTADVDKISRIAQIFLLLLAIYFVYNFVLRIDSKTWMKNESAFNPFNKTFPVGNLYDDYHWSSLISGHYFGLKSARPNSTLVSMMWFKNKVEHNTLNIRHWCNVNDRLDRYTWTFNDFHNAGHQKMIDGQLHINTSFIKVDSHILKARITMQDVDKKADVATSIIFYVAAESERDRIELIPPLKSNSPGQVLTIKVDSQTSGKYTANLKITEGKPLTYSHFVANSTLDALNEAVLSNIFIFNKKGKRYFILKNSDDDQNVLPYNCNFAAYQLVFDEFIQIELEMLFNDVVGVPPDFDYVHELAVKEKAFVDKFNNKFPLQNVSLDEAEFAREILSNVIGGISYFYGHSLVRSPKMAKAMRYGPLQLLTATPSRPFFPRGFLWDEGFHQLIISRWDPQLSMLIINTWLGLMNKDGWIPREVMLDDESRARVPGEYLVQHTNFANPPSLFLAIEALLDSNQTDVIWLEKIYPRLDTWFKFFNSSQAGKFMTTYRWQGRNDTTELELNPKTMSSGLDDYPRASHPTRDEIHLDLRCWLALASRVMSKIGELLAKQDTELYQRFYATLSNNTILETRHWSQHYGMFCDFGFHSDNVKLVEVKVARAHDGQAISAMKRKVITPPTYQCVHEFGYVSLFPFIMTIIEPNNDKLGKVLRDIEDPNLLWTQYGLRSLAKNSSYYGQYNTQHDPPYWRGAIWININFMVLKGLDHYRRVQGPHKTKAEELYGRLRVNIITNMFKQYKLTGFVWEQYSDLDGHGKGTRPFTGWSALIINIMSETY